VSKWQTARVDTCDSRVVWYKPASQILQQDTSLVEIITSVMLVVLLSFRKVHEFLIKQNVDYITQAST
jgi:hypothetical protein